MGNIAFSSLMSFVSGIVCYVLLPLVGEELHMAFVGTVSTMAGCAIAIALHKFGNWLILLLGAVGALVLFIGSFVTYLHVVERALANCNEDIFCVPNQALFLTAGMFLTVGYLVTLAKVRIA